MDVSNNKSCVLQYAHFEKEVKIKTSILKRNEYYSMHISEDHHLNKQVLQFWKALQQFNDNVHLIIHVDKQGLDRLTHCC